MKILYYKSLHQNCSNLVMHFSCSPVYIIKFCNKFIMVFNILRVAWKMFISNNNKYNKSSFSKCRRSLYFKLHSNEECNCLNFVQFNRFLSNCSGDKYPKMQYLKLLCNFFLCKYIFMTLTTLSC